MNNEETRSALTHFYDSLARRDGEAMAAMYAPNAQFEDPIFRLTGSDIGKMWIALTRRVKDFSIAYTIGQAAAGHGIVELTARYLYGGRRAVTNVILSELDLENGLIVRHRDQFDFPRWAAQALGTPGRLLGRFEFFQRMISRKAARTLGLPAKH
ncbi:MAG TPA: nuclear transport factor 2 family protein [Thermoanaerobaculia bacterium]|nr:nuclear transport factor 2 family protein [Thermoanaerobaculia bacterium]